MNHSLEDEAAAFNQRIEERIKAGYIPDLRRGVKCDYFYKSFWRDPHFTQLYLGKVVDEFFSLLGKHSKKGARILDVGCGAGYISLELARAGYHVLAIDIADKAIQVAKDTLQDNPFKDGFGSLEYRVAAFEDLKGTYDVVLFSGSLHHFDNIKDQITKAGDLLAPDGLLLCSEPCHEQWRPQDAAQVALIRGILSITGNWFESDSKLLSNGLSQLTASIHKEFLEERDPHEVAQSPHDNSSTGDAILEALKVSFDELEFRLGVSFIYRVLGGLRGEPEVMYKLADFIAAYDGFGVSKEFLKPNGFFFIGKLKS